MKNKLIAITTTGEKYVSIINVEAGRTREDQLQENEEMHAAVGDMLKKDYNGFLSLGTENGKTTINIKNLVSFQTVILDDE